MKSMTIWGIEGSKKPVFGVTFLTPLAEGFVDVKESGDILEFYIV